VVGKIDLVQLPVFEADDLPFGAASLFNSLHIRTVADVIRRDLLVQSGEPYDSFLVAESARLLRSRAYLGDVQITPVERGPDTVDLVVRARELWTLELSVQPGGGGGAYSLDVGVSESNFRGRAQSFNLGYVFSDRRRSGRIGFLEPAFLYPHVELGGRYSAHPEGNTFTALLAHPFWAQNVPWYYSAQVERWRDNRLFYKETRAAFAWPQTYRRVRLEAAHAWGLRHRLLFGAGLEWEQQEFGRLLVYDDTPPYALADTSDFTLPDRRRVVPSVGVRLEHPRYVATRFLDRFGPIEDFPAGLTLAGRYGRASADLGSTVSRDLWSVSGRFGLAKSPVFCLFDGQLDLESSSGASEGTVELQATALCYVKPATRHTLALRLAHDGWYQANRQGQLFLGAQSGMRGLLARGRDGTRRWIANVEYRYFSGFRVLTLDLGAVVFTDLGQVWDRGGRPPLHDAEFVYGAGLRIGLGRAAGEKVFRIDAARGADGWIVTYGTRMYFSFDLNSPMRF
jgi:hypothetical protein